MDRSVCCCFSGHRPRWLPWGQNEKDPRCVELKLELAARLEAIYSEGFRHFMCGMAIGCDVYFAEAVLALRDIHEGVTLEAVIPCGSQSERWTSAQRQRYNSLLDASDKVTVLQYEYSPNCMMRRNQYMVDRSALLLCCFSGRPGGTMNTILYARRNDTSVVMIDL